MGDDEPSADAVQVSRHIKGMLMSTVLKDVVVQTDLNACFDRLNSTTQGISSN
jgi:hypothetical protein